MRAFFDVLRFDLRLHTASPLFAGVALVFFALNFLTQARIGINLGTNATRPNCFSRRRCRAARIYSGGFRPARSRRC